MQHQSNLPDFKRDGEWVRAWCPEPNVKHITRAGLLWLNIVARCNPDGSEQERYRFYRGTYNDFSSFQEFAEWCQRQPGYTETEENGKHWSLDKDLARYLVPHNHPLKPKVYGTGCVFVPARVNTLIRINAQESELPAGVTPYNDDRYRAQGRSVEGRRLHLGICDTPMEAHAEWQIHKSETLRAYARAECPEHLKQLIHNMANRIEQDYTKGVETKDD